MTHCLVPSKVWFILDDGAGACFWHDRGKRWESGCAKLHKFPIFSLPSRLLILNCS